MRWFASIRIPGFGRLAPRIGAISGGGRRASSGAATSAWFWIGFLGVLWLAWYVVATVKR